MNRLSLRWLVLLPLLATITMGFVVFAVYIDQSDRATRLAEIDKELTRAERAVLAPPTADSSNGTTPPGPSPADPATSGIEPPVHLTLSVDGEVTGETGGENPFTGASLADLASSPDRTVVEIEEHRVLVSPQLDGEVSVTALSLDGYQAATSALRRTLLLGGLILAFLESAMAWWLAGRLARPLAAMAATANRIADGALDTEVEHAGGAREVADLSHDIERMVARLRVALDERERSEAAATRARDDMRRFLADVSHEIRTPLAALKGYSDLYEKGMLAEPGALDRAMSRVGSESVRLHSLVNSMLQLTGSGGTPPQVVCELDLADVAGKVLEDLRAAHPECELELVVEPGTEARVIGDPARLHQAILNLGANACTHTDSSTPITVGIGSSSSSRSSLAVSVIDHGVGVHEAVAEDIFLPFYRTDPSRVRNGTSGAGLGLAITRQVAHEHDGSVSVHPTPGGGATFTLLLPRSPGAADSAATQRP